MTPAARLSAAIGILDAILGGDPAERALIRWARASRYAGSADRSAIRDIVYDCLRQRRSLGFLGGGDTGRALVLAHTAASMEPDPMFTGAGHAPARVTAAERTALRRDLDAAPRPIRLDLPDFLEADLAASLGTALEPVMLTMRQRAPVDLRVNTLKATLAAARAALLAEGIVTERHRLAATALRITENARRVGQSRAYRQGLVELQDASSQHVAEAAGAAPGMTILDFCAGGGGKSLALAAIMLGQGRLLAHDALPARMKDLPARARRAGAVLRIVPPGALGDAPPCDLVFVDAPCSGTGAWRRMPESKWRLAPPDLTRLAELQDAILAAAARHVRPGGVLAYATCSLLAGENEARIDAFVAARPEWTLLAHRRLSPLDGGDGFFFARLRAPG